MYFLGWALWLRGDLTEAQQQLEKGLALGERIGETHLLVFCLLALTLTALRRHDTEAVRTLIPQARKAAGKDSIYVALTVAAQAWLAWQDGHPEEVIRQAGRIDLRVRPRRAGHRCPLPLGVPVPAHRRAAAVG